MLCWKDVLEKGITVLIYVILITDPSFALNYEVFCCQTIIIELCQYAYTVRLALTLIQHFSA